MSDEDNNLDEFAGHTAVTLQHLHTILERNILSDAQKCTLSLNSFDAAVLESALVTMVKKLFYDLDVVLTEEDEIKLALIKSELLIKYLDDIYKVTDADLLEGLRTVFREALVD